HQFVLCIYNDKFNELMVNLKNDSNIDNKTFRPLVLSKEIKPQAIAFLAPEQIHPERWKHILNKKAMKLEKENNMTYTDMYQCKRCREKKSSTYHLQTRSADEPMTIFVTCMVCYHTYTVQ
ncbi:MAG: transcription elongation factor TFIIS, partial [Edafosvirus sp.]